MTYSDEAPICDDHDITQFDEEYYGYRCPKCRMFIPYGCEPWVEASEPDDDYDWEISRPVCQDCGEKALPGYVAGDRCERLAKRNACVPETVCGGRLDKP